MKKIITLIAITALTFGISTTTQAKGGYSFNRLYGSDRYKTSVNISNNFSSGTVQNVIVSSGNNFPDALAGSVLSKKLNAPILLVSNDINNNSDSIEYIQSHLDKGGNIYVLGGKSSVSDDFMNYMQKQGYNVIRLGGSNRFDTNKSIVNYMNVPKGTPVVLVNGYGFADALSISSVAALKGYPILMANSSNLPNETKETITNLQPRKQ
ncbi:cell wall-binding repeat-containing protein [Clostridium sp. DJ247]|uniref:cell wall-binding repeat-containing protein n=1 Tax=Clostridium sp. DJ247 TaxID=2726188 RepID=UPI0016245F31|nr:cell wall-binding repeat-containing protein [Clostridium sp. DJ247]MBC2579418.1 cell wall-binding repeat-containing protein [Clostridium sp. DJ247]